MVLAAGIVLITAVFLLVAWPFLRPPPEDATPVASPETLDHWVRQKAEAYGAIKDAEFDFQMGKLSQADFQFIRDKYAARALEAIAALEQARTPTAAIRPVSKTPVNPMTIAIKRARNPFGTRSP